MAKVNGQIVSCDRCGTQIFRKCIGEGETDGGFTRWNKFEEMPDGWDLVAVPRSVGWTGCANAHNGYLYVCPACHNLWDTVVNDGFLKGTPWYKEEEDGK